MLRRSSPLRRTPLRKVSKKHRVALEFYFAKRKNFLALNPQCQIAGCTAASQDIHHKAKRGKNLNEEKTWLAVCRYHHDFIHSHPSASRKAGLLQ